MAVYLGLPSKAWSCQTLQYGLGLVRNMSMELSSLDEPDVEAMQLELKQLEVGIVHSSGDFSFLFQKHTSK